MSTPSTFTVFNSMSLQEILTIEQSQTPSDEVLNQLAGAFKHAHDLGLSCPMFETVLAYFVQQKYPNKRLEHDNENVTKLRRYGRLAYNHVHAACGHVSVLLIMPQIRWALFQVVCTEHELTCCSWANTSNEYAQIRFNEMMQLVDFNGYLKEFDPLTKALLEHLEKGNLVSHVK